MTLSYSEYDALISLFESYKTPAFLPSLDEIAMFEKDPSRWLRFAIYLSEFSPAPSSDTEHYQAQLLSQFLYAHINLLDDDSTTNVTAQFFERSVFIMIGILTEKPSAARNFAKALGARKSG